MHSLSMKAKLPSIRKAWKLPTSSQDAIPPRALHTPPPTEIAQIPRPDPIPQSPQNRELQIIEDRYIDGDKLLEICQQRYGVENCQLRYKNSRYYLKAPEIIDEDTLSLCEYPRT